LIKLAFKTKLNEVGVKKKEKKKRIKIEKGRGKRIKIDKNFFRK